jgi:hypothetical protein
MTAPFLAISFDIVIKTVDIASISAGAERKLAVSIRKVA